MKIKYFLIILMAILGISAKAVTFDYTYEGSTLTYEITSVSKCKVIGEASVAAALSIPEKAQYNGRSYSVTEIGERAFEGCTGVTSVTIPNSVTSIGNSAFSECAKLTSVTIPNSVISIGDYAFYYCSGLTSFVIPSSVVSIGANPFAACPKLESIIVDSDNQYYCSVEGVLFSKYRDILIAFPRGKGANTYNIPNSVTSIGDGAFYSCGGLTSVTIPNSVTLIGNCAFSGCIGLTSVTIPNSVTSIGNSVFRYCYDLTSVTISNSVTSIGNETFYYCESLSSVTIPNSVTSIGNDAFSKCSGLTSVTIPNSVTSIGDHAFGECYDLKSITIPNSVSSIGDKAFVNCYSLTSVTIPNSVTSIGRYAFGGCSGLTWVTIPNSVTSIGDYAFGYSGLTSVTIPNSVTSIGDYAFGYSGLTSVTIPNSVTSIGDYAFCGCDGLTSVTIPNSVTSIGNAFSYCDGLTSVTIPNSVTSIGDYAFYKCDGLTSVTIPNSVTSIGNRAFAECKKLTEIYCSAAKPPKCYFYTFYYVPTTCKVNVPRNSVAAYRAEYCWNKFTNIIGYYVPGGENESLYIQDFVIEPGKVAYMPVRLRAERDYSDFTTDVYLPEGLEVVKNEEGYIDVQYACVEDDAHLIFAESQPDGAIRVSVMSFGNAPMTGNSSEELFRLPVRATSSLASEPAPVWMRNTLFKDANYGYLFNDTNSNINSKLPTNVSDIESATCAPVEFYNFQGQRVVSPERGKMYIRVQGGKSTKVVF